MNPDIRGRRSIRLKGWDYTSPGWYFITLCTRKRECLFGDIANGDMLLNDAGRNVKKCWQDIPEHFPHVTLDEFVIMPNHVHGIIFIAYSVGAYNHTPQKLDRPIRRRANVYSPLPDNPLLCSPSKTAGSITGSQRPGKYWNDLKKKLLSEGYAQLSEKIGQLKLPSPLLSVFSGLSLDFFCIIWVNLL